MGDGGWRMDRRMGINREGMVYTERGRSDMNLLPEAWLTSATRHWPVAL